MPLVSSYSVIPRSPNRLKMVSSERNSIAYPRASPTAPPMRHPRYLSKFFVTVPPCETIMLEKQLPYLTVLEQSPFFRYPLKKLYAVVRTYKNTPYYIAEFSALQ